VRYFYIIQLAHLFIYTIEDFYLGVSISLGQVFFMIACAVVVSHIFRNVSKIHTVKEFEHETQINYINS